MYILKNSLVSIVRNKGRNVLIGIIILVIACSSTVTLAIKNTASKLVKDYEESHDVIASISFNRQGLSQNFKGGENARKENIEAFNSIEAITLENVKNYGNSENLKSYNYIYSTSLNSDSVTKATDSYEYEVENKQTTTNSSSSTTGGSTSGDRFPGDGFRGERHTTINNNTTTVITRSREIFQSSRNLTGDFQLDGYSSYDAMTNFVSGTYKVTEGEMISDFSGYECVISSELATLNELKVGDNITFKNPKNSEKTYQFKISGIYTDNSSADDTQNMYSKSVNNIITGSGIVEIMVSEDSTLGTNVTSSFIIKNKESIEAFIAEVKQKGLSEYYTVNTNLEELENATKSIENVQTFATTFLFITLAISAIVLFVINMINIRERKYEIGVFRTIGISKFKVGMQFILELLIVSIIMLGIGTVIGGFMSKPVGNMLLKNEIENVKVEEQEVSNNFGKGPMNMKFTSVQVEEINSINAVVDFNVILQLLGIGMALTLISSISSMISIQRFSPLTILRERS